MRRQERVILLSQKEQIKHAIKGRFDRIYFGSETCAFLIPSISDIERLIDVRKRNKIDFSIVTPYVMESDFSGVRDMLYFLEKKIPGTEVIVNDWGVLNLVRKRYNSLKMLLGRVLSGQARGPLLLDAQGRTIPISSMKWKREDLRYFRSSILQNSRAMNFLKKLGLQRFGFDAHRPGFLSNNEFLPFEKVDLYYPFIYVMSSPYCFTRAFFPEPSSFKRTEACPKLCLKKKMFKIDLSGERMFVAGNRQTYFNESADKKLFSQAGRLIKVAI